MARQSKKRGRHVPQRTCVGCRTVSPKRSMTRVVLTPEGAVVDLTGKQAGRGAYLHNRRSCWERGLQAALSHALKTEISEPEQERLRAYLETLPLEAPEPQGETPEASR